MLVSTAHAQGRGVGGSRGQFARRGGLKTPKRGAGSNPRRKPVGRSGARAHTQQRRKESAGRHGARQSKTPNFFRNVPIAFRWLAAYLG